MPQTPSDPNRPRNARRDFFRHLLLRGLDKAEETTRSVGERFNRAVQQTGAGAAVPPWPGLDHAREDAPVADLPRAAPLRYLRPPGALPDPLFADACSRCGECVRACPAQCIRLEDGAAKGLPHIVARESPCVVCDELACMKVCPTGALKLVGQATDIRMGVAVVDHARCLRAPGVPKTGARAVHGVSAVGTGGRDAGGVSGDEGCRLCITPCPFGEAAIGLDADGRIEVRPGCTGCGLCERACPTEPASVWVERNG